MSYARSPRPLCSITIGIRPSPLGSSIVRLRQWFVRALPARSAVAARPHHGIEGRRLVGHRRACEDPVDDVLLEHGGLEVAEALGLLVMPAYHGLRLLVGLRMLVHEFPDLLGPRFEMLVLHEFGHHQPERDALRGLRPEHIDADGEILGLHAWPI